MSREEVLWQPEEGQYRASEQCHHRKGEDHAGDDPNRAPAPSFYCASRCQYR